jgi:AAA domain
MTQQIITNAAFEHASPFPKIRFDEYRAGDSVVFAVFDGKHCWKGIAPMSGLVPALWFEQLADDSRGTLSLRKERWLRRVWRDSRKGRHLRVGRFPRNDQEGELLLSELVRAHSDGERAKAIALLGRIRKHLRTSITLDGSLSSSKVWDAVPALDPNLVKRTKWLIRSFLVEGTIQLVYGERGSLKTTLLLAAAKAVANGEEFLGMKTRHRRILVMDYENPASVIKARNDDLALGLADNKNFKVWDRFHGEPPPRPGDPWLDEMVAESTLATGHGPWIIFDSWASLLKEGEGGEFTGQIAPIYLQLRKLADAGATVTVLDHTRKHDKNSLYGGQDKEAKADTIHGLVLYPNKVHSSPVIRVESWLKRFAPQGEGSFSFEPQGTQDEKGNWHITGLLPALDPVEKQKEQNVELMRNLIKANPNSGQEELARLAADQGIARDQAIAILKAGVRKYWQVRRNSHNKFSYSLT